MIDNNKVSNIPCRLHNVGEGGVAGADEVIDDNKGKSQQQINAEVDQILGAGGSVDERIEAAVAPKANSADVYAKTETYNKTELNSMITTPEQGFVTVTATDETTDVTDVLPATGEADTIYRVGNWNGSQYDTTCYTEYAWNGTNFVLLNVKEYGIDDEPTAASDNLVKSGGVAQKLIIPENISNNNILKNSLILDNGTIKANNDTYIYYYPAIEGATYKLTNICDGSDFHHIVVLDSNDNVLGSFFSAGSAVNNLAFTCPENADKIAINNTSLWHGTLVEPVLMLQNIGNLNDINNSIETLEHNVEELNSDIENLENEIDKTDVLKDYYLSTYSTVYDNGVLLDNGEVSSNTGYNIYYYNVEEGKDCKLTNICLGSGFHHILFLDENNTVLSTIVSAGGAIENYIFITPTNTAKVAVNTSKWNGLVVPEFSIKEYINGENINDNIETLQRDVKELQDTLKVYNTKSHISVYDNGFMLDNGSISNNDGYNIYYYNVEEGDLYKLTNICLGSGFHQIIFLDINDSVLSTLVNAGNSIENYSFTIPSSAVKIAVNTSKWNSLVIPTLSEQVYINVEDINNSIETLEQNVEELQDEIVTKDTDLLVKIANNRLYVRTSFDETKDIITSWETDNINHQLSQKYCWLGSKESSFNDIISQSVVHNAEDSIPPMNTHNYWFFTGLHTYVMPKVTIDVELSDDNVGSIWRDSRNYQYKIQSIDGYNVSLIPIIIANGDGAGKDSKGWYFGDNVESTLYHVSGGTYTQDITVSSTGIHSSVIVVNDYKKIFLDNTEISEDGEYKGNELKVIENTQCLDPKTITDFDNLTGDVLFNCTRTYIFYKTTITCRELFDINTYMWGVDYGSQPMGLRSFGDYSPMIIIPKCKAFNYDGNVFDWKYPVDCSSVRAGLKTYYHNIAEDIETVNDMPDRVIEYHKNQTNNLFGIGYASGLSLISGVTQKSTRPNYTNLAFNFSNDDRNKVYFKAFYNYSPQSHEAFEINRYYSYFNPNGDALTYYYKEGNKIVVYVHCYALVSSGNINLPIDFDGKEVTETIEKTDNIQLITTTVTGKILKFKTTSATYSYIVFVIQ